MQFKNIIASIAAFSVASAVAGPLPSPNEGFEIVERGTNKVDAAVINAMAKEAATHAKGEEKPTEDQVRELFNTVTGSSKRDLEERQWGWNNAYWNRYAWNNNGINAYYYCWNTGYLCYYNQFYNNYYLWWGYNNAYSWPVNSYYYGNNYALWNYYGW